MPCSYIRGFSKIIPMGAVNFHQVCCMQEGEVYIFTPQPWCKIATENCSEGKVPLPWVILFQEPMWMEIKLWSWTSGSYAPPTLTILCIKHTAWNGRYHVYLNSGHLSDPVIWILLPRRVTDIVHSSECTPPLLRNYINMGGVDPGESAPYHPMNRHIWVSVILTRTLPKMADV